MTTSTDRRNGLVGDLGIKAPVRCATTANITLSGLQTIDGITVVEGDRVLVKDQTDTTENGIRIASSSTWERAPDFDGNLDIVDGTLIFVRSGTAAARKIYEVVGTNPITVGTSAITFEFVISAGDAGLVRANNLSDLANASTARTNLGVAIGSDVQAYNANLAALAGLTGASNKLAYFTGAGAMAMANLFSNKNAIINGDFDLWRRSISATPSFASVANGDYTADRFAYYKQNTSAVHTISRSTDVPTFAQAGRVINYSVLIDCTTLDAAIGSSEYVLFGQMIEGFNWRKYAQKSFTLSFWVKATKPGTYCVAFVNGGGDRSYVAEYTINLANTWEFKTINVSASPSAGNWNYTTGIGLQVLFVLAGGSGGATTPSIWQTGNYNCTSNQVNGVDSTSNDFRLAGIQLEEGSVATPFENMDIERLQSACNRYYQRIGGDQAAEYVCQANSMSATACRGVVHFHPKRALPSFSFSAQNIISYQDNGGGHTSSVLIANATGLTSCAIDMTSTGMATNAGGNMLFISSGFMNIMSEL